MHGKRKGFIVVAALVLALALAMAPAATAAPVQQDDGESVFCSEDAPFDHPVAAGIAETYEVDYGTVIGWFCEGLGDGETGFGFGQIMLALQTAKGEVEEAEQEGEELDLVEVAIDLLQRRDDGEGWGQIWQDLELIGRPEDAGPPFDVPPGQDGEPGPPFGDPPGQDGEPGPPFGDPPGQDGEPGPPFGDPPGQDGEPGPPFDVPPENPGEPEPPVEPGPPGNGNGAQNGRGGR